MHETLVPLYLDSTTGNDQRNGIPGPWILSFANICFAFLLVWSSSGLPLGSFTWTHDIQENKIF